MTYAADYLNGFLGIFDALHILHIWGIPLVTASPDESPEDQFAIGLTWSATPSETYRPGFPSWSWTSCTSRVDPKVGAIELVQTTFQLVPDRWFYVNSFWLQVRGAKKSKWMRLHAYLTRASQQLMREPVRLKIKCYSFEVSLVEYVEQEYSPQLVNSRKSKPAGNMTMMSWKRFGTAKLKPTTILAPCRIFRPTMRRTGTFTAAILAHYGRAGLGHRKLGLDEGYINGLAIRILEPVGEEAWNHVVVGSAELNYSDLYGAWRNEAEERRSFRERVSPLVKRNFVII